LLFGRGLVEAFQNPPLWYLAVRITVKERASAQWFLQSRVLSHDCRMELSRWSEYRSYWQAIRTARVTRCCQRGPPLPPLCRRFSRWAALSLPAALESRGGRHVVVVVDRFSVFAGFQPKITSLVGGDFPPCSKT